MIPTIVAGNWKMHKTRAEATAFAIAFEALLPSLPDDVEIVLCPPFTALAVVTRAFRASRVRVGAQNMHWDASGAYTGEISAPMLIELGVRYAILGHSERREFFGETDEGVRLKTAAALAAGLTPIVAVGETLEERSAGRTVERVTSQTRAALDGLHGADIARVVMAYEPIWAIGTGRNCDPREADVVMGAIRTCVPALSQAPILYGGSMKANNAAAYAAQGNINGGLVGGASLDPAAFAAIVTGCGSRA